MSKKAKYLQNITGTRPKLITKFCSFCISDFKYVTCGSVLKLHNPKHNVRLHSHEVKYGSGSGQQVSLSE